MLYDKKERKKLEKDKKRELQNTLISQNEVKKQQQRQKIEEKREGLFI